MTHSRKDFSYKKNKEIFYKDAKNKNIRARSYFKLQQINEKFNLTRNNLDIIDLGASPGGWLQYIDEKIKKGNIIGIDILEIRNTHQFSNNISIIEDDFNNIEHYNLGKFDLVLSDMAPEFSGDSKTDRGRTHKLNISVMEFCKKHLKEGGNCVFKSFEGEDLQYVTNTARNLFQEIKHFKPKSSLKKSSEAFIICLNKKL